MYKKFHRVLQNASEEQTFKTNFGEIKNLRELRSLLFAKGKKLFNQYVNEKENHFANWIEHVFDDKELSNSLRQTTSFHTTVKVLDTRIKYLELWLEQNKDKEELTNYLLKNQSLNLNYEPEFHRFETLSNHDTNWVDEFFPEKQETKVSSDDEFEQKLSKEVQMLKELQTKYQSETQPSIFQRIFKKK